MSYTKGPWVVDAMGIGAPWNIDTENGESICIAHDVSYEDIVAGRKERAANANLIAAAPELLEALEAALEWIDCVPVDTVLPTMPGFDRDWVDEIRAKAKGEI